MNQTSQIEFRTEYKKIISTLNQAVNMNVALDNTDFSALTSGTTDGSIYYMFNQRMNVLSTATDTAGIGATSGNYTLFFNDGMAVSFGAAATTCTDTTTAASIKACSAMVDVNGKKKPNKFTATTSSTDLKDQFGVHFFDQQVLPAREVDRTVMYTSAK